MLGSDIQSILLYVIHKPKERLKDLIELGRHLTKMLSDKVSQTQGYRWIDALPAL